VAILNGRIERIGDLHDARATEEIDAAGRVLAPGFIDVHTHDDTVVIRQPADAAQAQPGRDHGDCRQLWDQRLAGEFARQSAGPDEPAGHSAAFVYPRFSDYRAAVEAANTTLNVAALVGHTALRSNHLDDLLRTATPDEIAAMREQLRESLRPARSVYPQAWPMPARSTLPPMK
jgi:N-acyl-D-amino-acid deacylase